MRLQTERRANLKTQSIYGTLPGSTDESIIVLAHMDAYYDGALDNASGLSVMVSMAEHFSKVPRAQRRRSMVFVGTAGHHVGSPNSPYLRDQRADLIAKTALIINCEHVSAAQTLNWSTRLARIHRAWSRGGGGCTAAASCSTSCLAPTRRSA